MVVHLRRDVSATETDDGMVLLDERGGRYWQLNPSGALVLRLLLDNTAADAVAEALAEGQPVSVVQARVDVAALVRRLRAAGLVDDTAGAQP